MMGNELRSFAERNNMLEVYIIHNITSSTIMFFGVKILLKVCYPLFISSEPHIQDQTEAGGL